MKKFAIGCLVILIIGGALLAVGAYLTYQRVSPMLEQARNYAEELGQVGEFEKEIKNREPYSAPANRELTPAQVERFVRVQQSVRKSLGQRFDELEEKYKHLKANSEESKPPSFREVFMGLSELSKVFVQARRFQVDALNAEGFSRSEYNWVRARVYQAAGVEATAAIDVGKLEEAIKKGTGTSVDLPETKLGDAPARNRELVKPYLKNIDEWLPLAFFGL